MYVYLLFSVLIALWVAIDAFYRTRGDWTRVGRWAGFTFVAFPIAAPLWQALRPLQDGERRAGGKTWHILKNLSLSWTLVIGVLAFKGFSASSLGAGAGDEASGGLLSVGMVLLLLWVLPMLAALGVGLLMKSDDVEEGAVKTAGPGA